MPACRQCGKENPAGTTVCSYCATPISADSKGAAQQETPPQVHKVVFTPPAAAKPIKRATPIQAGRAAKSSGGIEWIPWSEMSAGQKAGRATAILLALLMILFLLRMFLGGAKSSIKTMISASPQPSESPLTDADRADGLVSICQTVKIYGIPKDDNEAADVARHSEDLFKLPGNRNFERSIFILTTLAREFQSGALTMSACPQQSTPGANQTPAAAIPTPRS
ncbi:MAG: hypothetical protein Q7S58_04680 [Candidatus Binatus sp.]|uniref:hypothetical protein n=1 Tax=Candidatus Binatus sp. TaxID=2811406 RepID=UPI002724C530|nr:hypothetical protein [Candidatus Binatus sp.]MDO8431689.1 hypothetical protein [Candidatus Binatus sp.]